MKKILTLSITLILVAGFIFLAKSADIDTHTQSTQSTAYPRDRHIVKSSNGTIVVLYKHGAVSMGIRGKKSTDDGATWINHEHSLEVIKRCQEELKNINRKIKKKWKN